MKNLFIFIFFLFFGNIYANSINGIHPDLREAYIRGRAQYEKLERQNKANEEINKAEENFYVINLDTEWIGKNGVGQPTASVVIPDSIISLNSELIEFNNYLISKGKADRVYVCYSADLPLKILSSVDFLNVKFNVVRDQFNAIKVNEPNKSNLAVQSITNLNQFQSEYRKMTRKIIDGGVTPIPSNPTWTNPNRILISQFALKTFDIESGSGSITNAINANDRQLIFGSTKTNDYVVNSWHYSNGFDVSVSTAISAKVTEYFTANPKTHAVNGILEGIKAYYHNVIILGSGEGIAISSGIGTDFNNNNRGGQNYTSPHAISLPQSISEYSVYDYTKILTENEKADLISQISQTLDLTGANDIKLHFYITDNRVYTEMDGGAELKTFLENLSNTTTGGNGLVIHLHFDQQTNKMIPTLKINGEASSSISTDHLIKVQSLFKEAMEFAGNNPQIAGTKLLIFFAVKAINVTFKFLVNQLVQLGEIPAKYWDPSVAGYDSTIADVFAFLMAPQMAVAGFLFSSFGVPEVNQETVASCVVALFCGMWQCIIRYAQDIGNAVVMITDCILYKDKREQLFQALQEISLNSIINGMLPQFYVDEVVSGGPPTIQKKSFEAGYNIIAIAVSILEAYETVLGFGALIKGIKKIGPYLQNLAGTTIDARRSFIDNMVILRRTVDKGIELFTERVDNILRYCIPNSKLSFLDLPNNKPFNFFDVNTYSNINKYYPRNWAASFGIVALTLAPNIAESQMMAPTRCTICVIRSQVGKILVYMNQFSYVVPPGAQRIDFPEFEGILPTRQAKIVEDGVTGPFDEHLFNPEDFEMYRISEKTIVVVPRALINILDNLPESIQTALRGLLPDQHKQLTKVLTQLHKRPEIISLLNKYEDMHKIWFKPEPDDLATLKDKYTDDFIKETGMTPEEIDVFEELIQNANTKTTLRNNRLNGKHLEEQANIDHYISLEGENLESLASVANKVDNLDFPNRAALGEQVKVYNGTSYSIPDKFFIEKLGTGPNFTFKAYIADCKANGADFTNVQNSVFAAGTFPKPGLKILKTDNPDLFQSLDIDADEILFDLEKANVYKTHATVTGPPSSITSTITTNPID